MEKQKIVENMVKSGKPFDIIIDGEIVSDINYLLEDELSCVEIQIQGLPITKVPINQSPFLWRLIGDLYRAWVEDEETETDEVYYQPLLNNLTDNWFIYPDRLRVLSVIDSNILESIENKLLTEKIF